MHAVIPILHAKRQAKNDSFQTFKALIASSLKSQPPSRQRRLKQSIAASIISVKLSQRDTMDSLYQVSLSLLAYSSELPPPNHMPPPTDPPARTLNVDLPISPDKTTLLISTATPRHLLLRPYSLRNKPLSFRWLRAPVSKLSPLPTSQRFLLSVPWIVPPWSSHADNPGTKSYTPPPWLLPPVPPDPGPLPSSLIAVLRDPWIVPPWVSKFLSAPPTTPSLPGPPHAVSFFSALFLRLLPWLIPPW